MDYTFECKDFDPDRIFFCGQAFRWEKTDADWRGIAGGRFLRLTKQGDTVTFWDIDESDIPFWREYFDLDTDYGELIGRFSADRHMELACRERRGIRVLRQDVFETLISFIISQNNNIKRISGIIARLCECFGEKKSFGCLFPTPKDLDGVTAQQLSPLRAGFRAKYIADAVQKVNSGEVRLDALFEMDCGEAREELKKIKGVGDKVADCVLLFGCHKTEAFPRDVWIKRVESVLYPDGLPECITGAQGIAQQYLFDYARAHPELFDN